VLVITTSRIHVLATLLTLAVAAIAPRTSLGVDLFSEDFEGVTLGPIVTYASELREREAWSETFPAGWVPDNSLVPGVGDPIIGATEFEGWTVVDKNWWVATSGDQGRAGFVNALGKVAVADTDEHDDYGTPTPSTLAPYDATLSTPSIALGGAAQNTVNVSFNSSWMPEEIQKVTLTARYNNGTNVPVIEWTSVPTDPTYHASAVNETVTLPLQNPVGATSVTLDFHILDATNNWWWAIDNISVYTGGAPASDGVLRAVIDRGTSNVKVVNNTGAAVSLRGYSLQSAAGAFNEANAAFLADGDPNWIQLTAPNATGDLSEGHLGTHNLANGGMINLGNNVWRKYYQDLSDVSFQYLVAGNDEPIPGIVEFTGNGGASYELLDLNFNGAIEIGDWDTFRAGYSVSLTGLGSIQRYQLGDLDGNGQHTLNDFLFFKTQFEAALGAGSFEAALAASQVPEPATGYLLISAVAAVAGVSLRRRCARIIRGLPIVVVALLLAMSANSAHAQLTLFTENFEGLTLGASIEEVNAAPDVWTDTPPAGWTQDDTGVPGNGPNVPGPNNGKIEWAGWAFTDKTWWSTQVDGQDRQLFNRASGTVMVADPDEWDDEAHPNELYDTFITTPKFAIPAGIPAEKIKIAFDSSWRDEGADDDPILANNQRATINVSYFRTDNSLINTANAMTWDSVPDTSPNFHNDAPNEAVEKDLLYTADPNATKMSLTFGLDLAENDWWWAVDNIRVFVPAEPSILRIDTATGHASIVGGDVIPVPINSINIESTLGVLNGAGLSGLSTTKPDSVDGPGDPDSTVGNSSGEFWQNLSATNNSVAEAFLFGSSTYTTSRTDFLGTIFNTATPVGNRDVTFKYTTIYGDPVNGMVEYCTGCSPAGVPGDYNNNGTVDAADYVLWRNNGPLLNDPTLGVQAADYAFWRSRFGATSGSGSGSSLAAVPEPGTAQIACLAFVAVALVAVRRRSLATRYSGAQLAVAPVRTRTALLLSLVAGLTIAAAASAAVPPPPVLDRNYRMGDAAGEGAVNGGTVSTTRDSMGAFGTQDSISLTAVGSPKYELLPVVGGGPVPMRPDNGTGFAIRLNPTATSQGQHLKTLFDRALNFPERSISSTFAGGNIDYEFIRDRGFQLWVLPTSSGRADIVMDTLQHGALVNASGNFAMRYINTDYDTGVGVLPNNWYHLMVVRPRGSGDGSIMYVNGKAVARAGGTYSDETGQTAGDTTPLVVGANTSATAFQVGAVNRFQGLVDDLEMAVMGLNSSADYGEFVFERDNKYAAFFKPSVAADLTADNLVNMADVNIFVSNWQFQNSVGGLVVGDLTSRMKGDFNYDGTVNLADWDILNDLAPPGVGAAALALINGSVPEPGAFLLAAMAAAGGLTTRRRWPQGFGRRLRR
jgi:hypothetical protein